MDDESGVSMEPMEGVPLIGLVDLKLERLVHCTWLMERSRELIPETRGSVRLLEGTICYS